jgi:hypothetical protein
MFIIALRSPCISGLEFTAVAVFRALRSTTEVVNSNLQRPALPYWYRIRMACAPFSLLSFRKSAAGVGGGRRKAQQPARNIQYPGRIFRRQDIKGT